MRGTACRSAPAAETGRPRATGTHLSLPACGAAPLAVQGVLAAHRAHSGRQRRAPFLRLANTHGAQVTARAFSCGRQRAEHFSLDSRVHTMELQSSGCGAPSTRLKEVQASELSVFGFGQAIQGRLVPQPARGEVMALGAATHLFQSAPVCHSRGVHGPAAPVWR